MKEWGSREMYRCVAAILLFLFIFHIIATAIARIIFKCPFLPDHGPADEAEESSGGYERMENDAEQVFCDDEDPDDD